MRLLPLVLSTDHDVLKPASGAPSGASSDWAEDFSSVGEMEFECVASEHSSCDNRSYDELKVMEQTIFSVFVPATSVYLTLVGEKAQDYTMMSQVEEYVFPGSASSQKNHCAPLQVLQIRLVLPCTPWQCCSPAVLKGHPAPTRSSFSEKQRGESCSPSERLGTGAPPSTTKKLSGPEIADLS